MPARGPAHQGPGPAHENGGPALIEAVSHGPRQQRHGSCRAGPTYLKI